MAQQKVSFKKWWKNITGTKAVKVGLFHIDLVDSIQYAGVPVNEKIGNEVRCLGYIPTIVSKCGYFLKEQATQTRGIFRVSGSAKRVSELQIIFDTPPNYGSQLEWTGFTVHDAANVLRRYLNHLPDPVIPLEYYEKFRDVHRNLTDDKEKIDAYQELISKLPPPHACLLMYLLDLLSIFARHSEENLMDSKNLASVFQPGVISHPNHAMSPGEYMTSAAVLKFLIDNQSSFTMPKANLDEEDEDMANFGVGSSSQGRQAIPGPPMRGMTFHGGYVTAADHERIYEAMTGPTVGFDSEESTVKRRLSLQRPIIPRATLPGNTPQRSHSTTSSTSSHQSHSNLFSSNFIARRRSSRMSKTGSKLLSESDLQAVSAEAAQDLSDIPENPKSSEDNVEPLQRTSSIRKASTSPVLSSEDDDKEISSYLNHRKQLKSEGLLREPSIICQTEDIQFPLPPIQTDQTAEFKPSYSPIPPSLSTLPSNGSTSSPPHPRPSERSMQSFGQSLPRLGRNIPLPSTTAHVYIPDRPLYQENEGYIAPPPPSHHQEASVLGLGLRRISGTGQSSQNTTSEHGGPITRQRNISPGMAITRAKSNPSDLVSIGSRNPAHGSSGGHGSGHQAIEKFKGLFTGKSRDQDSAFGKDSDKDSKNDKRRESLTDKQRKYKSQEVTSSQFQGTVGSGWRAPTPNQTIDENNILKPERPYVQPPPPIPRESPQRPAPPPPEGSLMDLLDPPQRIGYPSGYASSSGGSRSGSPSHGTSSRRAFPTNSSFTSASSVSPTPSADRLYQGRGLASQGSSTSLELATSGDNHRSPQRSPRNRHSPQFDSLSQFSTDILPQQQQQHLSPYTSSRPHQPSGYNSDHKNDHEEGRQFSPPPPLHPHESSPRSRQGSFGSSHTYDSTNSNAQPPPTAPKSRERRSPRDGSNSSFRGDVTPPRARSKSSRNSSPVNSSSLKPLLGRNASHQSGIGGSSQHAPSPLAEGQAHGHVHGHGHGSGSGNSYVAPPPSARARHRAQSRDENHFHQRSDTNDSIGGVSQTSHRNYERERNRSTYGLSSNTQQQPITPGTITNTNTLSIHPLASLPTSNDNPISLPLTTNSRRPLPPGQ
ncbi:hypothetical protein FBU30_005431 [Linnemannia zychae]|nr:hypothetical protein FBU30_005431 [Linnemannia zychae]